MSITINETRTAPHDDRWSEAAFSRDNIHMHAAAEMMRAVDVGEDGHPLQDFAIVTIDGRSAASVLGREVEKDVFWTYFKNDLSRLRDEYEAYDDDSVFIVAIDTREGVPAGAIRMVLPNGTDPVKSVVDIANPTLPWGVPVDQIADRAIDGKLDLSKTIDVATLAIKKEYRPKGQSDLDKLSAHLYYAMYQWSRKHGYDNWIGIIDTRPVDQIQNLGNPLDFFEGVGVGAYIDSASSIPFYANLDRIDERITPIGLDAFFKYGQGLDDRIAFDIN